MDPTTGHGEGRIESFPGPIKEFFDSMKPIKFLDEESHKYTYPINLSLDKEVLNYGIKRPFLIEKQFSTSLEESNLVGNIYFANYGKWLGKVGDAYFFEILKKKYLLNGESNEFLCTDCEIYHLKEAMPFDQIVVKAYLEKIYKKGVVLYFEFFKDNGDQKLERLAYAIQTLVWGSNKSGVFLSEELPHGLLNSWPNKGK